LHEALAEGVVAQYPGAVEIQAGVHQQAAAHADAGAGLDRVDLKLGHDGAEIRRAGSVVHKRTFKGAGAGGYGLVQVGILHCLLK
jgi:hypothetical protein